MSVRIQFPSQFLIEIIEIWPVKAMGNFPYNSLSQSLKYDLWLLGALSLTLPYQNHWDMTYDYYGPFSLQFLIKIIEIWPMTAMGNFKYNSLSKSLKYDLLLLNVQIEHLNLLSRVSTHFVMLRLWKSGAQLVSIYRCECLYNLGRVIAIMPQALTKRYHSCSW